MVERGTGTYPEFRAAAWTFTNKSPLSSFVETGWSVMNFMTCRGRPRPVQIQAFCVLGIIDMVKGDSYASLQDHRSLIYLR